MRLTLALAATTLTLTGCTTTQGAQGNAYALIMEYRSDAFALDTGMSLSDCLAALPRNDIAHHVTYACERDPNGVTES